MYRDVSPREIEELFKEDELLKKMPNLKEICLKGNVPVKMESEVGGFFESGNKVLPISKKVIAFYFKGPDNPSCSGYVKPLDILWEEVLPYMPDGKKKI